MRKLSTAVLGIRDFRLLLGARMFGVLALQSQAIIVGWQVYDITKDPFMLGLTGLTEAVPAILCALFAGHFVDINHPRRVFLACLAVLCLNTLALFLIAGGIIHPPGGSVLPWIFAGVFISGLARAFIMPSSFSLLSLTVPRPQIPAASAWLNSGFQAAAIGGPAVAGIIYGLYGAAVAWLLPLVMLSGAFAMIALIKAADYVKPEATLTPAWKSIREGWAFVWKSPVLLPVMTLDMFAVFFGGVVAMLPAYADQILHVGPEGLGLLRAAPALGAIGMALIFALRPIQTIKATHLMAVVAGFGVCMIGFGFSTIFWLSMLFLAFSGAFDSVSMIMRASIMQLVTPKKMLGRVSSVNSMFVISSNEIGAFRAGVGASMLGLVPSVVAGGFGTLLVVALTGILAPKFRRTVIDSRAELDAAVTAETKAEAKI